MRRARSALMPYHRRRRQGGGVVLPALRMRATSSWTRGRGIGAVGLALTGRVDAQGPARRGLDDRWAILMPRMGPPATSGLAFSTSRSSRSVVIRPACLPALVLASGSSTPARRARPSSSASGSSSTARPTICVELDPLSRGCRMGRPWSSVAQFGPRTIAGRGPSAACPEVANAVDMMSQDRPTRTPTSGMRGPANPASLNALVVGCGSVPPRSAPRPGPPGRRCRRPPAPRHRPGVARNSRPLGAIGPRRDGRR
jgi:hypothetical protein